MRFSLVWRLRVWLILVNSYATSLKMRDSGRRNGQWLPGQREGTRQHIQGLLKRLLRLTSTVEPETGGMFGKGIFIVNVNILSGQIHDSSSHKGLRSEFVQARV